MMGLLECTPPFNTIQNPWCVHNGIENFRGDGSRGLILINVGISWQGSTMCVEERVHFYYLHIDWWGPRQHKNMRKWAKHPTQCELCHPWVVVPVSIRKQAEQAMRSNPDSSTPPWPLYQLLPPGSCPVWLPISLTMNCDVCQGDRI